MHLWLNADLDEGTSYSEHVADDEEDEPAVNELHSVSPRHSAIHGVLKEMHKLLQHRTRAGKKGR